ncbi:MAG: ORF6N domain-containing protein [Steroidobacteraceae bacterium]
MPACTPLVDIGAERVGQFILVIRRQRVLLDKDLAALYGVETRVLLQAVKRNLERFPADFMFELSAPEWTALRSQSVISKHGSGGRRYAPYAFTEQGVAMLSTVLNSDRIERKLASHDQAIVGILSAIRQLINPLDPKRRGIGFTADFRE